jgi:hypothetical protein
VSSAFEWVTGSAFFGVDFEFAASGCVGLGVFPVSAEKCDDELNSYGVQRVGGV